MVAALLFFLILFQTKEFGHGRDVLTGAVCVSGCGVAVVIVGPS